MLKGFTHARLACGCRLTFREGVEGSPVTVIVEEKGAHREALRPPTRLLPVEEEEYEEEG